MISVSNAGYAKAKLIVLYGQPLAGKTTLASMLAAHYRVPHLNTDDIAVALQKGPVAIDQSSPSRLFATARSVAIALGRRQLQNSVTVIVDAALPTRESWAELEDLCIATESEFVPVEISTPLPALLRRLAKGRTGNQGLSHSKESLIGQYSALESLYEERLPAGVVLGDGDARDAFTAICEIVGPES